MQYMEQTAREWVVLPSRESGKVRVLFQARTPLTFVLSTRIREEARKVSEISFNSRN
jgi:hypothetical protein